MQKQLLSAPLIHLCDFKLDDDFPIVSDVHIQKHQDLNSLHYHHILEIGYCLEGNGLFFINNQVHSFQKGDVSIIFPHQPHIAQSPDESPSQWVFISLDLDRIFIEDNSLVNLLLLNKEDIPSLIQRNQDKDLIHILKLIVHELDETGPDYKILIRHLLCTVMIKLIRLKQRNRNEQVCCYSHEFNLITPALHYIHLHYSGDITIGELAQLCNLSVTHFRVTFKKATTLSPLQYITDVRMKMAKTLLKSTELPILTISENVGYNTLSSFNRTFKELTSVTPKEYRKMEIIE